MKEKLAEGISSLKLAGNQDFIKACGGAKQKPKSTSGASTTVEALIGKHKAFMPIVWQASFTPADRQERVGIIHSLPSSTIDGRDIFPSIVDDGATYQCKIRVNPTLTDPSCFLVGFICGGMQADHPRMVNFVNELANFHPTSTDDVWAVCSFGVKDGITVREEIAFTQLCLVNGVYFLYVELLSKRRDSYYDNGVKTVIDYGKV